MLHYADVEGAHDHPERAGRLAGLIRSFRDGDGDTLVAGAGDDTAPGVLANRHEGHQSLPFFRAVDPDVDTFGNHDFDFGPDALLDVVRESPQTWLCANAVRDGRPFGADAGVVPWTVAETGGVRVGLFGLAHPETAAICGVAQPVAFEAPVPAARDAVAALRDRGVDPVVAVSHCGRGDADLAAAVDVDAILGGHVHDRVAERVDGTLLVRPGTAGRYVAEVDLDGGPTARFHEVGPGAPVDEAVADAVRQRRADTGLDEAVATVADAIPRTREAKYARDSRLGAVVADAYRWAGDADVGLVLSASLRQGPPLSGTVTPFDLRSVVPFESRLFVAEVSGADLRSVVRDRAGGPDEPWRGHLSGLGVEWDPDAEDLAAATVGGDPLADDDAYTVAGMEYLFGRETTLAPLAPETVVERLDVQYDHLVEYARERGLDAAAETPVEYRTRASDGSG